MDVGYTYGSPAGHRLALYAPPEFTPPESVTVTLEDASVVFVRLSDRELECGVVTGVDKACTSYECHRRELGRCQCGRHCSVDDPADDPRPPIRLRKAN